MVVSTQKICRGRANRLMGGAHGGHYPLLRAGNYF